MIIKCLTPIAWKRVGRETNYSNKSVRFQTEASRKDGRLGCLRLSQRKESEIPYSKKKSKRASVIRMEEGTLPNSFCLASVILRPNSEEEAT